MHALELERLSRENTKNKNRLQDQNTNIDCLKNDIQAQSQLIYRQKNELEQAKEEIRALRNRLEQQEMEQQRVESRYLTVLQKLEEELEDYKKKFAKLENKIVPLMDTDTVRLKILNQVQSNHHLEISTFKATIAGLKDEILKHRRENQILKHTLQNERMSQEENFRREKTLKMGSESANEGMNYLSLSMWKEVESRLKNSYQQARKEAQFYKDKYFAVQKKYQAKIAETDKQELNNLMFARR